LNFPNLTTIGSNFVLARNSVLQNIDGFQAVENVNGNLDMTGDFDTLSLPHLRFVEGDFNVESSSKTFQCPAINKTVIHGANYVCAGSVANPQPLDVDNSTTNSTLPLSSVSSVLGSATASATASASASASTSHSGSSSSLARSSRSLGTIPQGLR